MAQPVSQTEENIIKKGEATHAATPNPADLYQYLLTAFTPQDTEDAFDAHTLACILTLSARETAEKNIIISSKKRHTAQLAEAAGYEDAGQLAVFFPAIKPWLIEESSAPLVRGEDELCLADLLQRGSTNHTPFEELLASMVARRCQKPNHLWQDLGLVNRGELSLLMNRHFSPLARRNVRDMRWKKFFYRTLCRDEGYALCTAPSCSECCDFDACFGAENGESLLAHVRRQAEQAA